MTETYINIDEIRRGPDLTRDPFHDELYGRYMETIEQPMVEKYMPDKGDIGRAIEVAGKLSKPTKMPGLAWGIPAEHCITGGKLVDVEGSVCNICYARRGRFVMPTVQASYQRRFDKWKMHQTTETTRARWRWAVGTQIVNYYNKTLGSGDPMKDGRFFRVFDSGDNQSRGMILDWIELAKAIPQVLFYMPTKEQSMLRELLHGPYSLHPALFPDNLIIRVSTPMINGTPPPGFKNTSQSGNREGEGHKCQANFNDHQCGTCRACWDVDIGNINYYET